MRIAGCEVIGEHESEACRVVCTRAIIRSHCDSCEQLERDTRFGQLPDWKKLIVIKHCIAAVCMLTVLRASCHAQAPEDRNLLSVVARPAGGYNDEFKAKMRSVLYNLKDDKNQDFRGKVLRGKVTPIRICQMEPHDMASEVRPRNLLGVMFRVRPLELGHGHAMALCSAC